MRIEAFGTILASISQCVYVFLFFLCFSVRACMLFGLCVYAPLSPSLSISLSISSYICVCPCVAYALRTIYYICCLLSLIVMPYYNLFCVFVDVML